MRRKNVTSEMMMAYIEQALLLLMQSRPYSDITIGEITEKAGVNRSTYYRHFPTKDSIIKSYLNAIMEEYQNRFRNLRSDDYALYLRTMFETFYEKRADLLLIHQSGLSYLLLDVLMNRFRFEDIPEKEQFQMSYHIGGIHNNMLLWFAHSMRETPAEMTEIAIQYGPKKQMTLFGTEHSHDL